MNLKFLKGLSLDDLLNVDFTQLKEDEIAYVEQRLIKTANRRINQLRKSGLISQSHLTAKEKKGLNRYTVPKSRTRVTRGGKTVRINVRNKLVKSANKARDVLLKKTSQVNAIKKQEAVYLENINKRLSESFGMTVKLDRRRLKRVGKLMKKAEELYGMGTTNKVFSGSPQVLKMIVSVVKSRKYIKNDEAEQIIMDAIENGYESAQELMEQFLNEDQEGTTMNFADDE